MQEWPDLAHWPPLDSREWSSSMAKSQNKSKNLRRGVTVLEVLFATGIAIFGLLGIYSLLPLAARQANEANEATEGQAYGQRYFSEFMTRGFNQTSNWRFFNDLPTESVRWQAFNQGANVNRTGTSVVVSAANRHAICIDPGFFADQLTFADIGAYTFGPDQAYRMSFFPYYQDNYDPSSPGGPGLPTFISTPPNRRARMLRVSLFDATSGRSVIPAKVAEQLFRSLDDLSMERPEDATLPPFRRFDGTGSRAYTKTEFSWLATLVPNEVSSGGAADYYTLSIVVMHRRDRSWFPATAPVSADDRNSAPQGERLLGVIIDGSIPSFTQGGRITVTAGQPVEEEIEVGDWLMLSKRLGTDDSAGMVARWYRVIGAERDPVIVPDSSGATRWQRDLVLEGPDWIFDGANPTQATFLSNVVTVFERVIPVD